MPRRCGSPVPVEAIRKQTDERSCGFYAIQNLYVWAGLEPPEIHYLTHMANELYTVVPCRVGLRMIDTMALLGVAEFPLLFALSTIPAHLNARDIFPRFLAQGCALLMSYHFVRDGERHGHGVVAESWSDEGVHVLCSSGANDLQHGRKTMVPWRTQEYSSWVFDPSEPLGIQRDFIVVWPNMTSLRDCGMCV